MLEWLLNFTAWLHATVVLVVAILDALPGWARAALTGALLLPALYVLHGRIQPEATRFAESFRKASLVSLIAAPLFVWLFPSTRLVVFTETLPTVAITGQAVWTWFWWGLLTLWAAGFTLSAFCLARSYLHTHTKRWETTDSPEQLQNRVAHWSNRLNMVSRPQVVITNVHAPTLIGARDVTLLLPASTRSLNSNEADVVLLHALCHLKLRHRGWLAYTQFVRCVYWPVWWLSELQGKLTGGLLLSADELAENCYRDPMRYAGLLQKLADREYVPGGVTQTDEPVAESRMHDHIRSMLQPTAVLKRDLASLMSLRAVREQQERYTEPYERVVWFVGCAAIAVLVVSSPTLKEIPPEVETNIDPSLFEVWRTTLRRKIEAEELEMQYRPAPADSGRTQPAG